MSPEERITALEGRLAALEARLAAVEGRSTTTWFSPSAAPTMICNICHLPMSQCRGHITCTAA